MVPAPVLAQAWRGGARQVNLARFLSLCEVEAMNEAQARRVGVLAALTGGTDIVDLVVVEGASRRGDAVVTADANDIREIVATAGLELRIETV